MVLEPVDNLRDEELEDVAQLVGSVRRVGRVQAQQLGEAARRKGLDAAAGVSGLRPSDVLLVEDDDALHELLAHLVQRLDVDLLLVELD
jgi:hypothetical protein